MKGSHIFSAMGVIIHTANTMAMAREPQSASSDGEFLKCRRLYNSARNIAPAAGAAYCGCGFQIWANKFTASSPSENKTTRNRLRHIAARQGPIKRKKGQRK